MSDREASPDWLREFQAPARNFLTLSSSSDSSPEVSPRRANDSIPTYLEELESGPEKHEAILLDSGEDSPIVKIKTTKTKKASLIDKTKKTKATKGQKNQDPEELPSGIEDPSVALEEGPTEEDTRDKPAGPPVSSRLPLLFPEKVHRSKGLVECDGDSIDLSGDVGAVGRVVVSNDLAGKPEMFLDLKGTIYKSTIIPSRTFCIVTVGQSEAKIEAIMNDFIKLEPQPNVFEAETMIEGTLEGFSFDSDEEGEKMPKPSALQNDANNENGDQVKSKSKRKSENDANNENGDQVKSKTKRKSERSSGGVKKKAKAAVRPSKTTKKLKKRKK